MAQLSITSSSYGKSRVRLVKVERYEGRNDLREMTVNIRFEGAFDRAYTEGDNARILATDTMKNTVYALAAKQQIGPLERFGRRLAEHFLDNNEHVTEVRIDIAEHLWHRMDWHSFQKGGGEKRIATVTARRGDLTIRAGIDDLVVLKTANSAFEGYIRDPYTTLAATSDRILATAVKAWWKYGVPAPDFDGCWSGVRDTLLASFVAHQSRSVQHTLHAMAEAALAQHSEIDEIRISMPNRHCIAINLEPLGMENRNEVFVPIDEPHGLIEATMVRKPYVH
ncbi:MAG: urate oxidase [Acidobacteriota bacterium]|nr:urate oxidase [Acidobacteriota bacterium]